MDSFFYVCVDCHKTVNAVDKDGVCSLCVVESERLREKVWDSVAPTDEEGFWLKPDSEGD